MTLGPLMVDIAGQALTPEDREVLRHPLVGSVILFTRNYADPAQLAALVASIRAVRSPPLLVAVDHEGGRVQRFRQGFSVLPPMRRVGQEYDLDARQGVAMARALSWLMAAELRAVGIDFSFAPCVDLDHGVSEIIGDRSFHSDAEVVAKLAMAAVAGMREAGMAATAKHFPGHGAVVADSHLALPVDRRELAHLAADIKPYRRLIPNDLAGVMMAHVLFPAVDRVPASFSRRWVTQILRGDLNFRGVVFADDLTMEGASAVGGIVERAE
ncbi:MAG: beta-N-acetylhexosaminidase, partial [Pseudomonadota bacterium]